MGRTNDEEGETSAKACRSDDSNERPLKKARYVWQIKGKYHLKKPENAEGAKLYIADERSDGYALHPLEVAHHETRTQEHDAHSIGAVGSEVSKSDSACVPSPVATEVHSPMESEDLNPVQLRKWQARQVARCFVDNTINRVLEDMGFIPLPVDADDLMEDFAMSGLRRNDEHLEDTAVRMAIHSHGLQRAVADMRRGNQNLNSDGVADTCTYNFSLDPARLQNGFGDEPMDHMNRWCVPELHNQNSPQLEQVPGVKHMLNSASAHEMCYDGTEWNQPDTLKCTSNEEFCNGGYMNNTSTSCVDSARDLDAERVHVETAGKFEDPVFTGDTKLDGEAKVKSCASFEHTDFLDKAVAVAIQKKGLSTLSGIEYG